MSGYDAEAGVNVITDCGMTCVIWAGDGIKSDNPAYSGYNA